MLVMAAALLVVSAGALSLSAHEKGEGSKHKTEEIMKKGFKGDKALLPKVAKGKATEKEQKEFLSMLESLSKNKPHKGDAAGWKMKTGALVTAMKEVVEGKKGAAAKLGKAANCKACHTSHK
ncbi:MAG: hypothetical protein COA78_04945 [Blastopirellula sp.]|nr:MAG: hypothetical protein COA78_04945 [Blastopirellula sp.]